MSTPDAPISGGDIVECDSGQTLTASATTGNGTELITWYDATTEGNLVADPSLTGVGTITYYAEATDDVTGCSSLTRSAVTLTILSTPDAPVSDGDIVVCETIASQTLLASAIVSPGESLEWYDSLTGGSVVVDPSLSSVGSITYYAESINDTTGCISLSRTPVTLTIEVAPLNPVSNGDVVECETIASQTLLASAIVLPGESLEWYDSLTGGSVVVDPSLSSVGSITYYAESINDITGCISLSRTPVTLTISSVVSPASDPIQSFCQNVTISDLSISGSQIQWYDSGVGGTLLSNTLPLSDGQIVYASQTIDGCESINRTAVNVEIDIVPNPTLLNNDLEFCFSNNTTLTDLQVDSQGYIIEWYDSYDGGNLLDEDTVLENEVPYYVTLFDSLSGCESLDRLEIRPNIIVCKVEIFNALSLNDNGINDYMVIGNVELFPENSLEIFNRDGHLLYYIENYGVDDNLFVGSANVSNVYGQNSIGTQKLPTGSYLYVFKYFNSYEQKNYELKGFLTINSN